jgi:hypothetical protein
MFASTRITTLVGLVVSIAVAACDKSPSGRLIAQHAEYKPAAPPIIADSVAVAPFAEKRAVASMRGLVGGVARSGNGAEGLQSASDEADSEAQAPTAPQQSIAPGSMLVRTGEASLQVDSLENGIARVREVARRTNAVIANTSMEGGREKTRAASLELRIPSEHFDEAVNGLAPIGKVESVSVSVQDVGEEFVDVQARMTNARRLEQRLIELLANRTGKLADVLTVERELARVREEIERYEGRMRYLRTRASVSTLSIAIHEPYPIVAEHPGERPMRDAFVQAWRNLVGVTAGIIASLGVIIPLGILIGGLVLLGRRIVQPRLFPKAQS